MIPSRVERSHADLMRKCWDTRVDRRCTMAEAVEKLEFMLGESAVRVDRTPALAASAPPPSAAPAPAEQTATANVAPPAATCVGGKGSRARRKKPSTGKAQPAKAMTFDLRGSLMGRKARAAGAMREQTAPANDLGVVPGQGEATGGVTSTLESVHE